MKISNERLVNDINKLKEISKKQLPIKVSYAIAKNLSKIDSELKIFNEERQKLVNQYGEKDSDGNLKVDKNSMVSIKKNCISTYNKELKELFSIENDIDIHKFKINLLDGFNISAEEVQAIEYMIED